MTERHNGIDYIEFFAPDPAQARTFYEQAFGWKFEDYGPDYTAFTSPSIAGGFRRGEADANGAPLIVLYADDLAKAEQQVRAAGGTITKQVFTFPGGSRFEFTDPCGNQLAVWNDK